MNESSVKKIVVGLIIIALGFGGVLSGCKRERTGFYGYVDNDMRFISSDFGGMLTKVNVTEGDAVKQGQSLFILEPYPEEWSAAEAKMDIIAAQSYLEDLYGQMDLARKKLSRRQELKKNAFAFQEAIDIAQTQYASLQEQLSSAKANLEANQITLKKFLWMLNKKDVSAYADGSVFDIFYEEGEIVPAASPVLALIVPEDTKIVFFIPEGQLSQIKRGDKVVVTCDGCQDNIEAVVSYISNKPEFTPPVIFSEQVRSNLVFMIEALPDISIRKSLNIGQPVSVRLKEKT